MHMVTLYACVLCAYLVPAQPEGGIRLPGTGVTDGSHCHMGAGNCTQFSIRAAIVLTHFASSLALCMVSINLTIKLAEYNHIVFT